MTELPVVDAARCVGDGACVAACPTRSLEVRAGRPWQPRPADCVGCGACVLVCPTGAIRLAEPDGGRIFLSAGSAVRRFDG